MGEGGGGSGVQNKNLQWGNTFSVLTRLKGRVITGTFQDFQHHLFKMMYLIDTLAGLDVQFLQVESTRNIYSSFALKNNVLFLFCIMSGPSLVQKLRPDFQGRYSRLLSDDIIFNYIYHCNAQNPRY